MWSWVNYSISLNLLLKYKDSLRWCYEDLGNVFKVLVKDLLDDKHYNQQATAVFFWLGLQTSASEGLFLLKDVLLISLLFLGRKAQSAEITNSLRTKSQNCVKPELQKLEPQNVTKKAAAEETSGQGPRTIPTKSDDRAHVSLTTVQNRTVREAEASGH